MFGKKKKKINAKIPKNAKIKHSKLHKKLNKKFNRYLKKVDKMVMFVTKTATTIYIVNYLRTAVSEEQWRKLFEKIKSLPESFNLKKN